MQELKRYIKQLGEVVIYYRNVTMTEVMESGAVKKNETIQTSKQNNTYQPTEENIFKSSLLLYSRVK